MGIGRFIKISIVAFLPIGIISCGQQVNNNAVDRSEDNVQTGTMEDISAVNTDPKDVTLVLEKINAAQFDSAKKESNPEEPKEKITDFKIVQEKLDGIVEFEERDNYLGIKNIKFRNGPSVTNDVDLSECSFVAYFPSEDVLLLECGHTMDVSLDLKSGQTTNEIGNLNLVTTSSSGKYRLNKVFEGQECFYHFIQEKKNGRYKKIAELNDIFEKETDKWLCVTEKEFWTGDHTLYFGLVNQYREEGNKYEFYRVKIIDGNNFIKKDTTIVRRTKNTFTDFFYAVTDKYKSLI